MVLYVKLSIRISISVKVLSIDNTSLLVSMREQNFYSLLFLKDIKIQNWIKFWSIKRYEDLKISCTYTIPTCKKKIPAILERKRPVKEQPFLGPFWCCAQWAKTRKKFQFQMCVWVVARLPQRLKTMFFWKNFITPLLVPSGLLHSKNFKKCWF